MTRTESGLDISSPVVVRARVALLMEAVEMGDLDGVRQLIAYVDPMARQGLGLLTALEHGHGEIFDLLYARLSSQDVYWSALLCMAAELGSLTAVERARGEMFKHGAFTDLNALNDDPIGYLLAHSSPTAWHHLALRKAARHGHLHIVERLLPASDPQVLGAAPLREAVVGGHLDVVRRLLPLSGAQTIERDALFWAAKSGQRDIVEFLLSSADPAFDGSRALAYAVAEGHRAIVELLWDFSEPERAIARLVLLGHANHPGTYALRDRLRAQRERAGLQEGTRAVGDPSPSRLPAGRRL